MPQLLIDPVTRVGGHLRVEAQVADGVVVDAWVGSPTYRGIERILEGRDARDAWLLAERVCGGCGDVHALASVRAVERALGIAIPRNARLIRNLIAGTRFVVDHVVHFYHREALDWASPAAALGADPADAARIAKSMGDSPTSTTAAFTAAQKRIAALFGTGESGPLANGYWTHPAYRLSPALDLVVLTHYLQALDWQRSVMRIHAILGGKSPHPQTFLVGGMALAPEWSGPRRPSAGEHPWRVERTAPAALHPDGLADIGAELAAAATFVEQTYVPDVLALAKEYPDWLAHGAGVGDYLSFGELPEDDSNRPSLVLPAGRTMSQELTRVGQVDQGGVAETVARARYVNTAGTSAPVHPLQERTDPGEAGPPWMTGTIPDRYSWVKAPRYENDVMETGPLARMLVGYASSVPAIRTPVAGTAADLGGGADVLCSTLGRTIARALEARIVAARLPAWLAALSSSLAGDLAVADITMWDPATWPHEAEGWSVGEGPAGSVGHWVRIRQGRIAAYQIVDGSTWNASPRDDRGRRGPLEEALVGTPVVDVERPVEVLRTVHAFDPCGACAVHAFRPAGMRAGMADGRIAR